MRFTTTILAMAATLTAAAASAQTPAPVAPTADPANILNLDLSTGGRVQVLLRPDKAPMAVERIKTLAARHFYDGLTFHRVIDGFMAQGGDPKGTGEGGSELPDLKAEFNDLPHVRGTVSMARADAADSANSQFFIMLSPNFKLDGHYTAVGRVISGMAYVDLIEKGEPPANPSRIVHAAMAASGPVATTPSPAAQDAATAAAADAAAKQAVDATQAAEEAKQAAAAGDSATAAERSAAAKTAAEGAAQAAGDAAEGAGKTTAEKAQPAH